MYARVWRSFDSGYAMAVSSRWSRELLRFLGMGESEEPRPQKVQALAIGPEDRPDMGATAAQDQAKPSLLQLSLVLLWIGSTSFGGSTPPYFYQEMVRRRGWIKPEDFTEGYAVGRLLPGPTGANTLAYLIQTIRGPLVAAYCLIPYTLPSVLIMVALSMAISGPVRSPYVSGALTGAAMGGIGVLIAMVFQMVRSARSARLWPFFTVAAFVINGLLGMNFILTLLVLGCLSLACNRPTQAATKS